MIRAYKLKFFAFRMEKLYAHPDDVDLFTGLLSETKLAGALTGPTLACLIGLQFSHIRYLLTCQGV